MLFPELISKEFYEELNKEYKLTIENLSYRKIVMYLCFGSYFDKKSFSRGINTISHLLLSQRICKQLENKIESERYCAEDFLENVKKDLLPELEYSGWDRGCSRIVMNTGISKDFLNKVKIERYKLLYKNNIGDLVHYYTGKTIDKNWKTKKVKEDIEIANILTAEVKTVPLQLQFLDYFNSVPAQTFSDIVNANYNDAVELCKVFNFVNESVREQNENLLTAIAQQPKPIYSATAKTRRLIASPSSIPYLKKEIRQELTKGWVEFDIINCHLAIIAKEWNIPSLTQMLENDISIWTYLKDYYDNIEDKKQWLKKALYALVYGDSKKNINDGFRSIGWSKKEVKKFFDIPMINTIYLHRQSELAHIMRNKYQYDCFGEQLVVAEQMGKYDRKPARSILSQKAFAVELKLLEPIIKYSEQSKYVCVVCLYQFDGFSVAIKQKSRIMTHIHKIEEIMNNHIADLGYKTKIEYKINKGTK